MSTSIHIDQLPLHIRRWQSLQSWTACVISQARMPARATVTHLSHQPILFTFKRTYTHKRGRACVISQARMPARATVTHLSHQPFFDYSQTYIHTQTWQSLRSWTACLISQARMPARATVAHLSHQPFFVYSQTYIHTQTWQSLRDQSSSHASTCNCDTSFTSTIF